MRVRESSDLAARLRERLDELCFDQPPMPSLTKTERERLDVDPPPDVPRPAHTKGPYNRECWACNERAGVNEGSRFAAWYHAHIAERDGYDTFQRWTEEKQRVVSELERCRAMHETLKNRVPEVDDKIRFAANAAYVLWKKRDTEIRDELFTVFQAEKRNRDRVTFLEKCIRHTEYRCATDTLTRTRKDVLDSENRIRTMELRLESVRKTNAVYQDLSDTLHAQNQRMVNLRHLLMHYTGYKDYLYRTTIGPHICETATYILASMEDMRITESGMRFRINGLHINRAGGFQRSVASLDRHTDRDFQDMSPDVC